MRAVVIAFLIVAGGAGVAHAYPQWQLARDVTCTSCHLAPDGTGLLNENGLATAGQVAWKDHDAAFMYGAFTAPSWLTLGGDVRGAAGLVRARGSELAGYPMQAEVAASAHLPAGFTLHALAGFRRPSDGESPVHVLWSREHYVMWQQHPDQGTGLYVRVGRMEPTFGLRLAEHVVYTQRFGGRPLYYEAYAATVSYVHQAAEVHVTAFVHDPIATSVEHGDGAAAYAEVRLGNRAALGVEGKYSKSDDQTRSFGGVVAKYYLPGPDVLLLGEAELIRQHIDAGDFKTNQIATYAMATKPLPHNLQLDVGYGHFTQDTRIDGLYRDAIDANIHWFFDSHVELLVTTRLEILAGGDGGPPGGYALAQLHYRL
jgi:hypothetical protein